MKILCGLLVLIGSLALAQEETQTESHHGQRFIERLDSDGDGQITLDEFNQKTDEHFTQLDSNGDGVLTAEDFENKRPPRMHRRGPHPAARLAIAADGDESGDVTAAEWEAFLTALTAEDGSSVDLAILGEHAHRQHPRSQGHDEGEHGAERVQRFLDADGDGSLEIADLNQLLQGLDEDGDGALSAEEMPHRRKHRHHRAERGEKAQRRAN